MAGEVRLQVRGLGELKAALAGIVPKLRKRALRNALAAAARPIRDAARARVPVLSSTAKAPFRTPGTVRKAITVRTSKVARRAGNVGVFVNVRPAKAGQRGAKSKTDPFYWRWLEFGSKKLRAFGFLKAAAAGLDNSLQIFKRELGPQIKKLNGGKDVQL